MCNQRYNFLKPRTCRGLLAVEYLQIITAQSGRPGLHDTTKNLILGAIKRKYC